MIEVRFKICRLIYFVINIVVVLIIFNSYSLIMINVIVFICFIFNKIINESKKIFKMKI